ncbi:hypothetical protein RMHFA_05670 [Roseomonas mucosa]|nr:hypothetical protein RMHFA_05670 [Roseomonas mucosa]
MVADGLSSSRVSTTRPHFPYPAAVAGENGEASRFRYGTASDDASEASSERKRRQRPCGVRELLQGRTPRWVFLVSALI